MQWKTICFIIMGIFLRVCLHSCSKCSFKVCPVPVAYHCLWVFSPFHHPHPTPGPFPGSAPFLTPPVSSPASCSSIHKTQMLAQKEEGKEKGRWLTLSASGGLTVKVAGDSRWLMFCSHSEDFFERHLILPATVLVSWSSRQTPDLSKTLPDTPEVSRSSTTGLPDKIQVAS